MKSITTLQREYLKSQGAEGISLHQLVYNYMYSKSTNTYKQYNMLLSSLLKEKGYTGSINTMLYNYLTDEGYTSKSIQEKIYQFLEDGDTPVPPIGCAFPLSGDAAGLLPGPTPYIISGADSQTVSTGVDPQQPYYIATSSITTPFDVDWPADEVRWFKSVPISEAWDVIAENVSFLRSHRLGITSLVDLSQILVSLYQVEIGEGAWSWRVGVQNQGGDITHTDFPEKPSALYFGADGLGRAWVRVGSWVYRTDETFNTSQCGVTLTTEFGSGAGIGEASARLETDASTFDAFPDLSSIGINSQTDLCGNPVEIAP